MKHTKSRICTMLLLGIAMAGVQAQTTVPATGGEATGSGGSLSYTLGEVAYTTVTGTGGTTTLGVQQPFEILVETGIEQKGIDLQCVVYPNPVTDYLILNINYSIVQILHATPQLSYQLFNTKGQMIINGDITTTETKVEINNLTQGSYLLRVLDNDKAIKTFKIIKN